MSESGLLEVRKERGGAGSRRKKGSKKRIESVQCGLVCVLVCLRVCVCVQWQRL